MQRFYKKYVYVLVSGKQSESKHRPTTKKTVLTFKTINREKIKINFSIGIIYNVYWS